MIVVFDASVLIYLFDENASAPTDIASVEGAEIIFSDDADIRQLAGARFKVKGIANLPLPPDDVQMSLELVSGPGPEPSADNDQSTDEGDA